MARLAILKDNGEVIAEFSPEEFKNRLDELLETHNFEYAWQRIENELTDKLRSI